MTMHVAFICSGNICRSPMAEKMFAHDLDTPVTVSSAGLFTTKWNDRTDERTVQILQAHGYPASATKATRIGAWHYGADLLVAMDRTHVRTLLGRGVPADEILSRPVDEGVSGDLRFA